MSSDEQVPILKISRAQKVKNDQVDISHVRHRKVTTPFQNKNGDVAADIDYIASVKDDDLNLKVDDLKLSLITSQCRVTSYDCGC